MKIPVGRKSLTVLALGLLLTALAGCGRTDSASLVVDRNYNGFNLGADAALTFEREKAYAWSDWQLSLVVRHEPNCQRRYALLKTNDDALGVQVYLPERDAYIVRAGPHWYVTDLKSCRLQAFGEPPPVPGPLVGTFEGSGGELKFVSTSQAVR